MNNKVLSIVVPTYNMEKYLDRCLSSLIMPDEGLMNALEVLVVNDGSKDKSSEIAHGYQDKFPQTYRVIDKSNGNYGSCVNRGLKEATGKYIKVLDADDYFNTKQLQYYLGKLQTVDVDLVLTDYDFVAENGRVKETVSYPFTQESILSINYCIDRPEFRSIQMHAVTYKRANLLGISYCQTEGISYTDQEWVFTPMCTVKKLYYIKDPLYQYLVGRAGQTVDLGVFHKRVADRKKLANSMLEGYIKFTSNTDYKDYKIYLDLRIKDVLESIYLSYLVVNREEGDLLEFDQHIHDKTPEIYEVLSNSPVSKFISYKYICKWRKDRSLAPIILSKVYLFLKKIQAKASV